MNFLNPYSYIGGAVIAAAIGGSLWYQSTQIHHFHKLYDDDEVKIGLLGQKITDMTTAQNNQTKTTETNVTKVIEAPTPVIKIIQDMKKEPLPPNCSTPKIPDALVPYL